MKSHEDKNIEDPFVFMGTRSGATQVNGIFVLNALG